MTAPRPDQVGGDEVRRLRELASRATPGPWFAHLTIHGDPSIVTDPARPSFSVIARTSVGPSDYGRANNAFIAAARTALPLLLDAVERLTGERDAAVAEIEQLGITAARIQSQRNKAKLEVERLRERSVGLRAAELAYDQARADADRWKLRALDAEARVAAALALCDMLTSDAAFVVDGDVVVLVDPVRAALTERVAAEELGDVLGGEGE